MASDCLSRQTFRPCTIDPGTKVTPLQHMHIIKMDRTVSFECTLSVQPNCCIPVHAMMEGSPARRDLFALAFLELTRSVAEQPPSD
jgi:hypothetical protein